MSIPRGSRSDWELQSSSGLLIERLGPSRRCGCSLNCDSVFFHRASTTDASPSRNEGRSPTDGQSFLFIAQPNSSNNNPNKNSNYNYTMRMIAALVVLLIASVAAGGTPDRCRRVADKCHFKFDNKAAGIPVYDISKTRDNEGFTDRIVAKSSDLIGVINSDQASIVTEAGVVAAKMYLDAFTDNQFKTFSQWDGSQNVPEVGHETFQQGSRAQASGLCVKVSFSNWQVLNELGHVTDNVQSSDPNTDCVVFKTA